MDRPIDFVVIIPTFRRQEYLHAAITGALTQTDVSKKIIVIDDSPEGSAERIAKSFGSDILYRKMPVPTGGWPGRVRNCGLAIAAEMSPEPSFVHFLDDDDIPVEGVYAAAKKAFHQHPDVGVVYGTMLPFCKFSTDAETRKRQDEQLSKVREWHAHMAAISKIYGNLNATSKSLGRWLYRSQYLFSHELFLCSGAADTLSQRQRIEWI